MAWCLLNKKKTGLRWDQEGGNEIKEMNLRKEKENGLNESRMNEERKLRKRKKERKKERKNENIVRKERKKERMKI